MRFAVLLAALLAAHTAAAASFDCKGATTTTERAICADAKLSALDERTFKAYTDAVATLGIGDAPDFRNPVADLLLRGHEQWTTVRDRCGADSNCLLAQYLRRIAVLTFHPDPQAPAPTDVFVGRYAISVDPARELVVMSAPGGAVLVHVSVSSADWTCDFGGIGRLDAAGRLRVTRPDFDGTAQGAHTVVLTRTRLGLALSNADKADDVSSRFCGDGGSLDQPYPRSDLVQ
jgi:uncharacterized protein YecT (DUF1311 family)